MKKLLAAQKELESVSADSTNPHFKNKYASLDAITFELKKVLNNHGLVLAQRLDSLGHDYFVHTVVYDSDSGAMVLDSKYPIITKDATDPQKFGGGVTYARRYSLLALFAIGVDDDDAQVAAKPKAQLSPMRPPTAAPTAAPTPTVVTTYPGPRKLYLPFGKSKGVDAQVAPMVDLEWVMEKVKEGINDPSKAQWKEKSEIQYRELYEIWRGRQSPKQTSLLPKEPEMPEAPPHDDGDSLPF